MNFHELVSSLTPTVVDNLRRSVELGKWPNGRPLTLAQREHSLAALLAWEAMHLPEEQRTGYLPQSCKSQSGQSQQDTSIIRFQDV